MAVATLKLNPTPVPPPAETLPLAWPAPPFYRLSPPPPGRGLSAAIEMLDGKLLEGTLSRLPTSPQSLGLHAAGHTEAIDLARARVVRLQHPFDVEPDVASQHGIDGAEAPQKKRFVLTFADGKVLEGFTRGFLNSRIGLYLFVPKGTGTAVECWLVPRGQLRDIQIGALLGDTLVAEGAVTGEHLARALEQQARQRRDKLGECLARRGIISPEQLDRALLQQKERPLMRLGQLLVESSLITPDDLQRALEVQATNRTLRLGDILVSMGVVSPRSVQRAHAEKLGIPFVNVRDFAVDAAALDMVPPAFAMQHQVMPLRRTRETLVVAVDDALNVDFEQDLRFIAGLAITPVIGDAAEIRARIVKEYRIGTTAALESSAAGSDRSLAQLKVEDLASQLERTTPRAAPNSPGAAAADLRVTDNALVRLVNKIIVDASTQGASDIHIESSPEHSRIRFRKDGDLENYLELAPIYRNALVSRIKIMAGLDIAEHRHAQDGKISFGRFGPLPIELRVAVVPTTEGAEDVVLRILGGIEPKPLDQLDLSSRDLERLRELVGLNHGLLLVCGPTGSGKTTTLHSVLHHINQPELKIWTAEDPVEISQPGLRQVQVNARIGWTFAAAIRAFLRADPDVIMVGEMRDAETTKIGIEASLTGHLVFSTLHTNSASESIVRLLDLGMDPFNFADALVGILSQRLARRLCPDCKKPRALGDEELEGLAREFCAGTALDPARTLADWRREFGSRGQVFVHESAGCPNCDNGRRGRIGIFELLVATPDIRHLVRTHGTVPQLNDAAIAGGMSLLKQDALRKVLQGQIDLPTARAASN